MGWCQEQQGGGTKVTMKDARNDLKRFYLTVWKTAADKGTGIRDNFAHTAS